MSLLLYLCHFCKTELKIISATPVLLFEFTLYVGYVSLNFYVVLYIVASMFSTVILVACNDGKDETEVDNICHCQNIENCAYWRSTKFDPPVCSGMSEPDVLHPPIYAKIVSQAELIVKSAKNAS